MNKERSAAIQLEGRLLMNNGPDSLAGNIVLALLLLIFGGIVVLTLISMVYYVWTVPRQSPARLHQIVKNRKNVPYMIVGFVGADILVWLTGQSDLLFNEWIALIGGMNVWLFSFTLSLALGAMRAGRHIRALEADEKHTRSPFKEL
jgi:hypothetical protein